MDKVLDVSGCIKGRDWDCAIGRLWWKGGSEANVGTGKSGLCGRGDALFKLLKDCFAHLSVGQFSNGNRFCFLFDFLPSSRWSLNI